MIPRFLTLLETEYSLSQAMEILYSPSIFKILEQENYQGWMVVEAEQDPAKANPFQYAKMGRNYIHQNMGI